MDFSWVATREFFESFTKIVDVVAFSDICEFKLFACLDFGNVAYYLSSVCYTF